MNKKILIVLCVIFAILIGLVFVKKNMKSQAPVEEEVLDIVVPSISMDSISEIVLRLGDGAEEDINSPQNVHLAKENGQWIVKTQYGARANEKTIAPVLEKIDQLQGELRSDKADLFEDYGISGDKALHVSLQHQDGMIHLVIGMKKAGYENNFIRFGEKSAVYVVNENLLGVLGVRDQEEDSKLNAGKWTDKRIARLEVDNVVSIAITEAINGADVTVFDIRKRSIEGKKQWQSVIPYPFGLSASKIKSVLESFNTTYARDIFSAEDPETFGAVNWTGTFTMENGDQVKLVRGAKDANEENYYVKIEGAGYFYLVPVSTFNGREQGQGNIFAANPLKVEEGSVEEINVKDIGSRKTFQAVKKASEAVVVEGAVEAQEAKPEDVWQGVDGVIIEKTTVNSIINKIRDMNLEVIPQSISSPKVALTLKINVQGQTAEYTISEVSTLENGKECHFLKLSGEDQNYGVSKEHVSALQAVLP